MKELNLFLTKNIANFKGERDRLYQTFHEPWHLYSVQEARDPTGGAVQATRLSIADCFDRINSNKSEIRILCT